MLKSNFKKYVKKRNDKIRKSRFLHNLLVKAFVEADPNRDAETKNMMLEKYKK